jgi:cytochrome bd-type quinol oxidase subunit 2
MRTNQFAQSKYAWLLAPFVAMLLIFTLVYAFATSSVTHPLVFATDATKATRYLRWLSEAVTLSLIALLAVSSDLVVWAATSSERGITFATWLAMSGTTGVIGLVRLFWWKHQRKGGRDLHHF